MRTLGNILWHIPFCGFLRSICCAIGGAFWCITIIGIPLGLGLFQLSLFTLAPFSQGLVSRVDLEMLTGEKQDSFVKGWSLVIRILYFPFGLFMAIVTISIIALEFITLAGIPCGLVEAKALSTIFNPINKKCVPRAVAEEIERRKANNTLNKYLKTTDTPISTTAAQVTERISEQNDAFASVMSEYLRKADTKTDEDLKTILQHKTDYHPQLVKAAEKILLDRITGVAKPKGIDSEPVGAADTEAKNATAEVNADKYKAYQPSVRTPIYEEEAAPQSVKMRDNSFDVIREGWKSKAKEESQPTAAQPEKEVSPVVASSNSNLTVLLSILGGILLTVGGALTYFLWYVPYVTDRDAPRTYVVADNVFLRSSRLAGVEYNILRKVPYGSEVITYNKLGEWAEVKVDGQEGVIAATYLLDSSDFTLLSGIWGDNDSKDCIISSKCRIAILDYFKNNLLKSGANAWQIYTKPINQKPNTVFYPRIYDRNSKFTDFVFIARENITGNRILVCYSFDCASEKPIFRFSVGAPQVGYIQNIVLKSRGATVVFDNGEHLNIPL